jgi:hypothetical protein
LLLLFIQWPSSRASLCAIGHRRQLLQPLGRSQARLSASRGSPGPWPCSRESTSSEINRSSVMLTSAWH